MVRLRYSWRALIVVTVVAGCAVGFGVRRHYRKRAAREIFMAAWDNDTEKVRWCLWLDRSLANARQDSIVSGEPGTHILYVATLRGSAGMIRLLLDSGADVNARSIRNVPPLHVAAMYRDLEIVSLLVERGADVNARTRSGGTALVAVRDTRPEIAELLRHHGATEPEHEPKDAPAPEAEEVTTEKGM